MVLTFIDNFRFKGGAKECSDYRSLLNRTVSYLNELLYARGYVTVRDLNEQLGRKKVRLIQMIFCMDGKYRMAPSNSRCFTTENSNCIINLKPNF